jgi:kelch-like protein 10
MRHYCITCKHLICIECIVDHSGHEFVRKEESTYVLKENADNIVNSLEEMMQKTESLLKDGLKMTKDLKQTKLKDMKKIDEKFEIISKKIMMKKALLKKEYNDAFNVELNKVN